MLLTAFALLMVMGILAPLGSYGWWAGWYGAALPDAPAPKDPSKAAPKRAYIVYLTGIGGISPDAYDPLEEAFLTRLAAALPDTEIIDDIFPYSNDNRALTGQRFFGWLWRLLAAVKGRKLLGLLSFIINIRNLWQVLVSSDDRFGPLYNYASAELVLQKLKAHGYPDGSGAPVIFIGYSGGGQVSLGAAPFIKEALGAPVHLISLGGVMSGEGGVLELDSLTHLYGARDLTQRLGYVFFPKRWPWIRSSSWNRAREQGIIRRVALGPMGHTGRGSYLDDEVQSEGESYLERTLREMVTLVNQQAEQQLEPKIKSQVELPRQV
jgi:hypothetical protein